MPDPEEHLVTLGAMDPGQHFADSHPAERALWKKIGRSPDGKVIAEVVLPTRVFTKGLRLHWNPETRMRLIGD